MKGWIAIGLLAVAVILLFLRDREPSPLPQATSPPVGASAADAAPQAPGQPSAAVSDPQSQPAENPFWALIEETRRAAGKDTGTQTELLRDRLSKLPPREILAFERWRKALDRRLYTWSVWGAAYVIEDGCSDDCFHDFRAYVISLGEDAFRRATTNPDSLAPVVSDPDTGDWESADDVAPDAYTIATGKDFPGDESDLSGRPRGTPWSEDHIAALLAQYPKLTAKFR